MSAPGERILGSYRLLERVGKGGMGEVYRAQHTRLGNERAVKVLPPALAAEADFLKRFEREAASAARLDHPNILPVYEYGDADGTPYLVMPYIKGGTLKDRMARGPVPPQEMLRYLEQMADALDFAHQKGLVHRDVKPANMLLDERGRLYLADFGIAKALEGAEGLTRTGVGVGTPEYMAPEQAQGRADQRSDLYALGVILYQFLTGRVPYSGNSTVEVLMKHLQDPLPVLPLRSAVPALPPRVEQIVAKALAKNPNDRYASGKAMVDDLREALATGPGAATPGLGGSDPTVIGPTTPYPGGQPTIGRAVPPPYNPNQQPTVVGGGTQPYASNQAPTVYGGQTPPPGGVTQPAGQGWPTQPSGATLPAYNPGQQPTSVGTPPPGAYGNTPPAGGTPPPGFGTPPPNYPPQGFTAQANPPVPARSSSRGLLFGALGALVVLLLVCAGSVALFATRNRCNSTCATQTAQANNNASATSIAFAIAATQAAAPTATKLPPTTTPTTAPTVTPTTVPPTATATVRPTAPPTTTPTRPPASPTPTRPPASPPPTTGNPLEVPAGWQVFRGVAQVPFAIAYPPGWRVDVADIANNRVYFRPAGADSSTWMLIATSGQPEPNGNIDVLRDQYYNGSLGECTKKAIDKTNTVTYSNITFAGLGATCDASSGLLYVRIGVGLNNQVPWRYRLNAPYGQYDTILNDSFFPMLTSLNIYANPK